MLALSVVISQFINCAAEWTQSWTPAELKKGGGGRINPPPSHSDCGGKSGRWGDIVNAVRPLLLVRGTTPEHGILYAGDR